MKRAWILALLLLTACGGTRPVRPPVTQPTVPTPTGYLAVWLSDGSRPVSGAQVAFNGTTQTSNADGWVGAAVPYATHHVMVTAPGFKPVDHTVSVLGHTDVRLTLTRVAPPTPPIHIDGRFFVTESGTHRPRYQSGLTLLVRSPDAQDAFLDETQALGFNGIRVFAGALPWAGQTAEHARTALPSLLQKAAVRGLYVYVSALTETRNGGYDPEAHLRSVGDVVAAHPNALLEIANETYHPTQSDLVNSPDRLREFARRVVPNLIYALGAADVDEPDPSGHYPTNGGAFNTAHLDRSRDLYNQVRRLREIEAISAATRKPVLSGEPIGIADTPMPGKQRIWDGTDPDTVNRFKMPDAGLQFSILYGALCRGFEIGCVWHSEDGLHGRRLGPNAKVDAEAFIQGWNALETTDRLTFQNARWAGSPVADANFDNVVRAYSFTSGVRGWVVLVGPTGDPAVRWGGGWSPVRDVINRPGIRVIEISR